jgi:hypothetical protein
MHDKELPEEYAVILQQISEDGGDNLANLAQVVQVERGHLLHIVSALRRKGLVSVEQLGYEPWLTVSAKGQRLIQYLWPESSLRYQL